MKILLNLFIFSHGLLFSGEKSLPNFPYEKGWYGADAAYSIPLSTEKTLWVFGDTFTSLNSDGTRDPHSLILGTMIGISEYSKNGSFSINHIWKQNSNHEKISFFTPENNKNWFWPRDPFIVNNELFIPLIVLSHKQEDPFFQFQVDGNTIAKIKNHIQPPMNWEIQYIDLNNSLEFSFAGTSFIYNDKICFYSHINHGNILSCILKRKLNNISKEMEFYSKDNNWIKNPSLDNLKIFKEFPSEFSVRYHKGIAKWIAVYIPAISLQTLGDEILYRTSTSPFGPWEKAKILFKIPERNKESTKYNPQNVCYAGKEHSHLSTQSEIVFSYICHNMAPDQIQLLQNLNLYQPKFIKRAIGN